MYEIKWVQDPEKKAADGLMLVMEVYKDGEKVAEIDHIFEDSDDDVLKRRAKRKIEELELAESKLEKKPKKIKYETKSKQLEKISILGTKLNKDS
jgi:hypothetical protein